MPWGSRGSRDSKCKLRGSQMIKSFKHFFPRDLMMGKLKIDKEKSIIKLYKQGKSGLEICQKGIFLFEN